MIELLFEFLLIIKLQRPPNKASSPVHKDCMVGSCIAIIIIYKLSSQQHSQ